MENQAEEGLEVEKIKFKIMARITGETKICTTQQLIFILLNLEIDCLQGEMFNLEADKITFQVPRVQEEVIL